MPQQHHADDRGIATESKFYLPATATRSPEAGRVERLLASLFGHRVGTSR